MYTFIRNSKSRCQDNGRDTRKETLKTGNRDFGKQTIEIYCLTTLAGVKGVQGCWVCSAVGMV